MKQKILVDMDGVLADVNKSLIEQEYTVKGVVKFEQDLNGVEERLAFPNLSAIVNSNHFFRHVPVMGGSQEGLLYLNKQYDVRIVSSATEFDNCLDDKHHWLKEHFPFIGWQQLVLCGTKQGIEGDMMLDDHPKNLNFFPGKRYIFTQPHNIYIADPTYIRVNEWAEVYKVL